MIIIGDEMHQAILDSVQSPRFGQELVLDLAGCNPDTIQDPEAVRRWLIAVVDHIGMVRHGPARVERFGDGSLHGTTGIQLITTSSVTITTAAVHAVDEDNSAFINIFSCRPFDPARATQFCVEFFAARAYDPRVLLRRAPRLPAVTG